MNILVNYKVYPALTFWAASPFSDNHTAIADTSVVQTLCLCYAIYIPLATIHYYYPSSQMRKVRFEGLRNSPPRPLATRVSELELEPVYLKRLCGSLTMGHCLSSDAHNTASSWAVVSTLELENVQRRRNV